MAFQPDLFDGQYREVSRHASDYSDAQVVLETNKRVVIRLDSELNARALLCNLKYAGYRCAIRPGRKTSAFYIQALLNTPY